MPQSEIEHDKLEVQSADENKRDEDSAEEPQRSPAGNAKASGSFLQLNEAADEFFDVINDDYNETQVLWSSDEGRQHQVIFCEIMFMLL